MKLRRTYQKTVPFLGATLYLQHTVVLHSYPPYFDDDPFKIYDRILDGKITWPKYTDPVAKYVHFAFVLFKT